jgi:hypothetical protein
MLNRTNITAGIIEESRNYSFMGEEAEAWFGFYARPCFRFDNKRTVIGLSPNNSHMRMV